MNTVKPEPPVAAAVGGARVAVSSALLLLLLVCQPPPAADSRTAKFAPGSDSTLLEAEEPELEFPDPLLPDLSIEAGLQTQQSRRFGFSTDSTLATGESRLSFADIRAPPRLS